MTRLSPVSVRARALVAALALSALPLLSAPAARAVEVPATAIDADTMLVAWVDVSALDQLSQGMPDWTADVPAKDKAEAEKDIKMFAQYQKEFKDLGGEGLLIGATQPAKDADKPEVFMLLKTKAGADRAKLEKLLHSMAEKAKGQQQQTAILAAKIEKYGTSTTWHAVTGESLVFPPLNGVAKEAAVFNAALKPVEKSSMQLCFRMLPALKAKLKAELDAQAKNPNQGDMMAGMMAGMMGPLVDLDTLVASGSMRKDAKSAEMSMRFANTKSAGDFATSFNGLIEMGKGLVGMQMTNMAKYGVDTKNVNDIIGQINLKADQNTTGIKLDDAFFKKCEVLAKQMRSAQEKMKADRQAGVGQAGQPPVVDVDDDGDGAAK